jgi:outer membrane receptor protein involved in Fe transport
VTYLATHVDIYTSPTGQFEDVNHIFSPEWMIRTGLSYQPAKSFRIHLNGRYVSDSFMELANNEDYIIPSFFLLNSRIRWTLNDQLDVNLFINNILDEQYFTDGAPVDLDYDGQAEGPGFRIQPPRHFHFTIAYNF